MDAQRIMDLVNSREFGKEYADLNWTGTYREYLDLVIERPEVARTAFQRMHDMIVGYGSSTYVEYKKEITHWKFFDDPLTNLSQFILPAISISVFTLAIVMRMVRATMLEVLGQDYVRTARAKGVQHRLVVYRHALRNALIPVVTIIGFEIGILMGGAAIVEIIFGLPGVGYVLLNAIFNRDYPVVQGATLLIAVIFVVSNTVVDIVYGWLDPRISHG